MIKIEKIFFCDHFEEGQFGKLNITGFNPSGILNLSKIPYDLINYLVITGKTDEQFSDLSLNINFTNEGGEMFNQIKSDLPGQIQTPDTIIPLFLVQPIKITINQFGAMEVSIIHEKSEIYKEKYTIVQGASPYTLTQDHFPASKFFSGVDKEDEDFVINLLGIANEFLGIFDNYVDHACLKKLLSKVPKTTNIRILTLPKHKGIFLSDASFNKLFPNCEIRTSTKSHDRFIIINDSEYYHFGHSLKDIANKKISRFSKIVDKEELAELKIFFETTWETSKKI